MFAPAPFAAGGPGGSIFCPPPGVAVGNELAHVLDLTAEPAAGRIFPGRTWHFQGWYRDPAAGGAGFNLTDGLTIVFQP